LLEKMGTIGEPFVNRQRQWSFLTRDGVLNVKQDEGAGPFDPRRASLSWARLNRNVSGLPLGPDLRSVWALDQESPWYENSTPRRE